MDIQNLAKAWEILDNLIDSTMTIREGSYDHKNAGMAMIKAIDEHTATGRMSSVDFSQFYGKTILEAAEQACEENGEPIEIALLIYYLISREFYSVSNWLNGEMKSD